LAQNSSANPFDFSWLPFSASLTPDCVSVFGAVTAKASITTPIEAKMRKDRTRFITRPPFESRKAVQALAFGGVTPKDHERSDGRSREPVGDGEAVMF
jgi:hypothetical protein